MEIKRERDERFIFQEQQDLCCVFWPAFGYCTQPEAGRNTLFYHFQTFLLLSTFFKCSSVILWLKAHSRVVSWNWKINWMHAVSNPGLFLLNIFKWLKRRKKIWKQQKKVFPPAFRCAQHPEAGPNTQHKRFLNSFKDRQTDRHIQSVKIDL